MTGTTSVLNFWIDGCVVIRHRNLHNRYTMCALTITARSASQYWSVIPDSTYTTLQYTHSRRINWYYHGDSINVLQKRNHGILFTGTCSYMTSCCYHFLSFTQRRWHWKNIMLYYISSLDIYCTCIWPSNIEFVCHQSVLLRRVWWFFVWNVIIKWL